MDDRRIFHIKKRLTESLDHPWTVEEMAQAVRLSTSHFKQLFKRETGGPPMAFLQNFRLEKACEMLSDADSFLQIKEIAFKCGFPSYNHFTREFKGKFGMTATEFRSYHVELMQLTADG